MEFAFTPEEEAFRLEARAFLPHPFPSPSPKERGDRSATVRTCLRWG